MRYFGVKNEGISEGPPRCRSHLDARELLLRPPLDIGSLQRTLVVYCDKRPAARLSPDRRKEWNSEGAHRPVQGQETRTRP